MASDLKGHAWAVLLTAHATLVERIEAALVAAGVPALDWYDVLWELEKADGRLRMHDLARRVVLSRSNLSRLADRLEKAGLVAREDWEGLRALQGNGIRQIALLLIPAAAVTIALSEPITRLVYERGAFDDDLYEAATAAPGPAGLGD